MITGGTWETRELGKCHFNFLASAIQGGILEGSWIDAEQSHT